MDITALREKLPKYDQGHLLDHWDSLDDAEKKQLYDEINGLDLDELMEDFERTVASANEATEKLDDHMKPLPADQCGYITKASDEVMKVYLKAF